MRDMDPPPDLPSYHLFTQPTDKAVLAERSRAWNGDEFSFHDVLDIINPLQHIPVVSTIYRYLTGDTIGALPRIAGDTLYGGPIGFLAGLVGASLKQESGKDLGETVVALVTGDDGPGTSKTAVAAASQPATDPSSAAGQAGNQGTGNQGTANQAAATPGAAPNQPAAGPAAAASAAVPAVSAASAAATPTSATVIGGSSSVKSVAQTTGRTPPTAADNDPRGAFLARAEAMRRQYSGSGGATPSNKVIPLQGTALPPAYYSKQSQAIKLTAPGLPGAPSSGGPSTVAPAAGQQPARRRGRQCLAGQSADRHLAAHDGRARQVHAPAAAARFRRPGRRRPLSENGPRRPERAASFREAAAIRRSPCRREHGSPPSRSPSRNPRSCPC